MLKQHLLILIISFLPFICKNSIYANDDSLFGNFTSNQTDSSDLVDSYQNSSVKLRRVKRGIFQLSGIIKCATGCKPLSYNRYGCFCGTSNFPGQPVDKIDQCCQQHDVCYSQSSCGHIMAYILPYQWKCSDSGEVKCTATLSDTKSASDKCSYQLCQCDIILGNCLKEHDCPSNKPTCSTASNIIPELKEDDFPKDLY